MTRCFSLCVSLLWLGLPAAALAQAKPPNIHFIVDTSGSIRELPQLINSSHSEFFAITTNGCSNPRLDTVLATRAWSTATGAQPLPDPGTGLGPDTGFSNLFQDDKFYAYMYWGDSTNPAPQWTSKEQACQSQVANWNTTNTAEYNTCLSCLSSKGYFKVNGALGRDNAPLENLNFIFWGRFLNFNPPKYVTIRAAIKKALQEVQNARVGYSYLTNNAPNSVLGRSQSPTCDLLLTDPTLFDSYRATYINDMNGLSFNAGSPLARTLLNIGYFFSSGQDIYRDVFGFGTGYTYPSSYLNAPLTSEGRSWCWGDQSSHVILITEGEPTSDTLSSTVVTKMRTLNAGPVYCPDWAPCGTGTLAGRDKGTNPAPTAYTDDNLNYMLDDVAMLLAHQDLQRADPPVVGSFDTSGQQSLHIHTISYGGTNNLLKNTAAVGNGLYFTAPDTDTLQNSLRAILCSAGAHTPSCPATP